MKIAMRLLSLVALTWLLPYVAISQSQPTEVRLISNSITDSGPISVTEDVCDFGGDLDVGLQFTGGSGDITIDWGDGTNSSATLSGGTLVVNKAVGYATDGAYIISIDHDILGNYHSGTLNIVEQSVIIANIGGETSDITACKDASDEYTATLTIIHPRISNHDTYTIDWGDATTTNFDKTDLNTVGGSTDFTHTYTGLSDGDTETITISGSNNLIAGCPPILSPSQLIIQFQETPIPLLTVSGSVCENGGDVAITRNTVFNFPESEGTYQWEIVNATTMTTLFTFGFNDLTTADPSFTGTKDDFTYTISDSDISAGDNLEITLTERNTCGDYPATETINILNVPAISIADINGTASGATPIDECVQDLVVNVDDFNGTFTNEWIIVNGHSIATAPTTGYTTFNSDPFTISSAQVSPGDRTLFIRSVDNSGGLACETIISQEFTVRANITPTLTVDDGADDNCGTNQVSLSTSDASLVNNDIVYFEFSQDNFSSIEAAETITQLYDGSFEDEAKTLSYFGTADVATWSIRTRIEMVEGCEFTSGPQTVTVKKQPTALTLTVTDVNGSAPSADQLNFIFCAEDDVTVEATGIASLNSAFAWTTPAGATTTDTNNDEEFTFTVSTTTNGESLEVEENLFGCVNTSTSLALTVNQIPGSVSINILESVDDGNTSDGSFCEDIGTAEVTLTAVPANAGSWDYLWFRNGVATANTGVTLVLDNEAESGDYSVEVTNSANSACTETSGDVTINIQPEMNAVLTISAGDLVDGVQDGQFCEGTDNITLTASEAQGDLFGQVDWYKDGVFEITSTANRIFTDPSASGDYQVLLTGTGPNSCESSLSNTITIDIQPLPNTPSIALQSGFSASTCADPDPGDADVALELINTGDYDASFTYQWKKDGADYTEPAAVADADDTKLNIKGSSDNGTYTLVITSSASCVSTASNPIVVDIIDAPTETPVIDATQTEICLNDGNITLSINGGIPVAGYGVQWFTNAMNTTTGATFASAATTFTVLDDSPSSLFYFVRFLSDPGGNNCDGPFSAGVQIVVNDLPTTPTIQIKAPGDDAVCEGETITLEVVSPVGGETYHWYKEGVDLGSPGNELTVSTVELAQKYTVIAEDANTCMSVVSNEIEIDIVENPDVNAGIAAVDATICEGETALINIPSSLTTLDYQLFDAASMPIGSPVAGNGGDLQLATPAITGNTTFTVEAMTNSAPEICDAVITSAPIAITSLPLPTAATLITTDANATVCSGDIVPLQLNVADNARGSYEVVYKINGGTDITATTAASAPFTFSSAAVTANATITLVSVTDTEGCNPLTIATSPASLDIAVEDPGNTTISNNGPVCYEDDGTVTFTVSDVISDITVNFTIDKGSGPVAESISGPSPLTYGDDSSETGLHTLTANATIEITSATTANGCSITTAVGQTSTITVLHPTASLTISDSEVCSDDPPTLSATIGGNGGSGSYDLTIEDDVSGTSFNIKPYTGGAITIPGANFPSSGSVTYTIISASDNGTSCDLDIIAPSVALTVNEVPGAPTISPAGPVNACEDETVILTGPTPASLPANTGYQWYRNGSPLAGQTSQTLDLSGGASGDYALQLIGDEGDSNCESALSSSTTVTINPLPTDPVISALDATSFCDDGGTTFVRLLASSDVGSFEWFETSDPTTVVGTASILSLDAASESGTYSVRAINGTTSCESANSPAGITVTIVAPPAKPVINESGTSLPFCQGSGSVTLTSSVSGDTYQWFRGASGSEAAISGATGQTLILTDSDESDDYYVQVTNTNPISCDSELSDAFSVEIHPLPENRTISIADNLICENTGTTFTVASAQSGVTYRLLENTLGEITTGLGTGADLSLATGNLSAGSYTYTIEAVTATTPACTQLMEVSPGVTEIDLDVNAEPTAVSFTTSTPEVCVGTPATLEVNITGGTAPFSIQYNSDQVATLVAEAGGNSFTFTTANLSATSQFTIQSLTDAAGCTFAVTDQPTVTVDDPTSVTVTNTGGEVCYNDNGEVTFTIVDGIEDYTIGFRVNGGAIQTITGDTPGNGAALVYGDDAAETALNNLTANATVTIVSALTSNGCVIPGVGASVTIPVNNPTYNLTIDETTICSDEPANLSVDISNGVGPYDITIEYNDGSPQSINLTGYTSGTDIPLTVPNTTQTITYTVTSIEDTDTNCNPRVTSGTDNVDLVVNELPATPTIINSGSPICEDNGPVTLTSSVTGTDFVYQWVNEAGATVQNGLSSSLTLSAVQNEKYQVKITTPAGCEGSFSALETVVIHPLPENRTISIADNLICENTGTTFTVASAQSGVTYRLLENTLGEITTGLGTGADLSLATGNLSAGSYTYTIEAVTATTPACTQLMEVSPGVTEIDLDVNAEPTAVSFTTSTPEVCVGTPATLEVNITGGTAPFSIQYNSDQVATLVAEAGGNSFTFTTANLSATSQFTIQSLTDAAGCTFAVTDQPTVTVDDPTSVTVTNTGGEVCYNDNGEVTFTIVDGIEDYTIGFRVNGGAIQTITGDTPGNGAALVYGDDAAETALNNLTANATVTIVSALTSNGCVIPGVGASVTIPVNNPTYNLTIDETTICSDEPANLSVDISNGVGPYDITIEYNDGSPQSINLTGYTSGTDIPLTVPNTTQTITYTVTSIEDTDTNCNPRVTSGTDNVDLVVNELPATPTIINSGSPICEDSGPVTLTSSVTGTDFVYQWVNEGSGSIVQQNTSPILSLTAVQNAEYKVKIITPAGCDGSFSALANVEIVEHPAQPTISISGDGDEFCEEGGNSVTLTATAINAGESYRWYRDLEPTDGIFDPIPDGEDGNFQAITLDMVSQSGDYYVQITGVAPTSCASIISSTQPILIKPIPSAPTFSATTGTTNLPEVCVGDENILYLLQAVSGATYTWTIPTDVTLINGGGAGDSFVILSFPTAGTQNLAVTVTVDECESPATAFPIDVLDAVVTSAISGNAEVCQNEEVAYSVTNTAGATYNWEVPGGAFITSGAGTNSITVQFGSSAAAGATPKIRVTETNSAGCESTPVELSIDVIDNPSAAINATTTICEGDSYDIEIDWSADANFTSIDVNYLIDGSTPGVVTINSGDPDPFILTVSPTSNTIYTLTGVVDTKGCDGNVTGLVRVNVDPAPMLELGANRSIPQGGNTGPIIPTTLEGTYSTISWVATPASGAFDNASIENPTFTPNPAFTGAITITATISDPGPCPDVVDDFILNVQAAGTIVAGNDETVCETEINIPFEDASRDAAGEYDDYTWSSSRPGTFSITNISNPVDDDALHVTFTPTDGTGNYTITLTAEDLVGGTNRPQTSDDFVLTVDPLPIISDVGSDLVVPIGTVNVGMNADTDNATTFSWNDGGAGGSFSNATIEDPTYILPVGVDGEFVLTLEVGDDTGPCPDNISDNLQLVIYEVNAGVDAIVCSADGSVLLEATVSSFFENIAWSAPLGATGTLDVDPGDPANPLKAQYTFGSGEFGSLDFTITATDTDGIAGTQADVVTITIEEEIVVDPLADQNILQGASLGLTGTAAGSYTSVLWEVFESDGTTPALGSFAPNNNLTTTFTPDAAQTGTFIVKLTASTTGPCPADTEQFTLTITPTGDTNLSAGADQSLCEGDPVVLDATVGAAYETITWSHNGTGSLDFSNIEDPTYTPGANETGTITFTIDVEDTDGPAPDKSDVVVITINELPFIDPLADQSVPKNTGVFLSPTVGGEFSSVSWTAMAASGPSNGTFSNAGQINTNYQPPFNYVGIVTITITLSDGTGPCPDISSSFDIQFNDEGNIDAGNDQIMCNEESILLSGTVDSEYETFSWSSNRAATFSSVNSLITDFTPDNGSGDYVLTLLAIDDDGEYPSISDQIIITVNPLPSIEFSNTEEQFICSGENATLTVRLTGTTSAGPWSFEYSDGTNSFTESGIVTTTHSFTVPGVVGSTTTYTLTSISENNGVECDGIVNTSANSVDVTSRELPEATLSTTTPEVCENETVGLIVDLTGTGPWNIRWSNDGGATAFPINGITSSPHEFQVTPTTGITEYSLVSVTESNGVECNGTISGTPVSITSFDAPSASISGSTAICAGETTNLTFTLTGLGGPWTVVYNDGTSNFTLSDITTSTFEVPVSPTATTTYTIVSVEEGTSITCDGTVSGAATVQVFNNASVAPSISSSEFCSGEEIDVFGNPSVGSGALATHSWSGSGALHLNATDIPNPIFMVSVENTTEFELVYSVTDENTCHVESSPITFVVNPTPSAMPTTSASEVCSNGLVSLLGNPTGGDGEYSHLWEGNGAAFLDDNSIVNPTFSTDVETITTFELIYTVSDINGCFDSQSVSITVYPDIEIDPLEDQEICEGEDIFMSAEVEGTFTSLEWSSSQGGTFSSPNSATTFFTPADGVTGEVIFTLTASNSSGLCPSTLSSFATEIKPTITVEAGSTQVLCQQEEVILTGEVSGTFSSAIWTTSGTGIIQNPESISGAIYTPSPDEVGAINFVLTATDALNEICQAVSDVVTITYNREISISLEAPESICQNDVVLIEGSVIGSFDQLTWTSSGNGTFSNPSTVVTNYFPGPNEIGNVELTLTASDNQEICPNTFSSVTVEIKEVPVVNAGDDLTINEGDLVSLTGLASGTFTELEWSSTGLGTFSSPNSLSTTYTPQDGEEGIFTLTLRASDESGLCDDVSDNLLLTIIPSSPTASFQADITEGCEPLTVNFTNQSQEADPESYKWDFGDGSNIVFEENPSHTFLEPGIYTVKLTVQNSFGVEDETTMDITVFNDPLAAFDVHPVEYFTPDPIIITNNSRRAIEYFWDFGDGNTSTEFEPSHVYTETGNYQITLTVTSANGCTNEFTFEQEVTIMQGGDIEIPNAFTPSITGPADGRITDILSNDVFLPVMKGVSEFEMRIFSRTGAEVFRSNDHEVGWNGFINGQIAPSGVYSYIIKIRFGDNGIVNRTGVVNLIR